MIDECFANYSVEHIIGALVRRSAPHPSLDSPLIVVERSLIPLPLCLACDGGLSRPVASTPCNALESCLEVFRRWKPLRNLLWLAWCFSLECRAALGMLVSARPCVGRRLLSDRFLSHFAEEGRARAGQRVGRRHFGFHAESIAHQPQNHA